MGMSLVLKVFGLKPKYWYLMMMLEEKSGNIKVSMIHPLGNKKDCIKFHGNPSNSRCDISVRTKAVS